MFCLTGFGQTANAQDWRDELQTIRRGHPAPAAGFFITTRGLELLAEDVEQYRLASEELETIQNSFDEMGTRIAELEARAERLRAENDNLLLWNAELNENHGLEVATLEARARKRFWFGTGTGLLVGLTPLIIVLIKN